MRPRGETLPPPKPLSSPLPTTHRRSSCQTQALPPVFEITYLENKTPVPLLAFFTPLTPDRERPWDPRGWLGLP